MVLKKSNNRSQNHPFIANLFLRPTGSLRFFKVFFFFFFLGGGGRGKNNWDRPTNQPTDSSFNSDYFFQELEWPILYNLKAETDGSLSIQITAQDWV
jgi:hypothetical protein